MTAYVVIELTEYQQLRAAASHHPARRSGPERNPRSVVVALLTAQQGLPAASNPIYIEQLTEDADILEVVNQLTTYFGQLLDQLPDHGTAWLRNLGLLAQDGHT